MDTRPPRVRSRISTPFPAVLAAALAPFIAACGPDAPGDRYRYTVPVATGDGWETASLQSVGVDPAPVVAMMEALRGFPDHWIHGIVVAKDGKLVFEEYFSGTDLDLARLADGLAFREVAFGRDSLHSMASVSKTVTSVLTGIALDRGELPGTDAPLLGWFPGRDPAGDLGGVTLEHALTMTTGIPWDESPAYDDPANDLSATIWSDDPVGLVLGAEPEAPPGERWVYNSGTTNLLGEVVRRATGKPLAEYAAEHLFTPLGIRDFAWYGFPADPDMALASSTLYLRPRDMAKIGQLYLDGGSWKGERIVPREWVERSVRPAVMGVDGSLELDDPGYGYLWWTGVFPGSRAATYYAAGFGGQFIFVLPDLDMVVASTGGGFEPGDYDAVRRMMDEFLVQAVRPSASPAGGGP